MKATIQLMLSIAMIVVISGYVFPAHPKQPIKKVSTTAVAKPCTTYDWYVDASFTDPVGTSSTIAVEIARLNMLFPGYTFRSSPAMGLMPFEYGEAYPIPPVIIYSNLY